jgi:hypothetical protein
LFLYKEVRRILIMWWLYYLSSTMGVRDEKKHGEENQTSNQDICNHCQKSIIHGEISNITNKKITETKWKNCTRIPEVPRYL